MNPFYPPDQVMQPEPNPAKRRPVAGIAAVCAIAAAAYFLLAPSKPLVVDKAMMSNISEADTFDRVSGSGARPLHIFISVDCSFCRQIEPELVKLRDVTVYYHLLPGHSPAARSDSANVWCAADKVRAWETVARGGSVPSQSCDDSALDRNLALARKIGLDQTPSLVLADGTVLSGALSSEVLAQKLASSRDAMGR